MTRSLTSTASLTVVRYRWTSRQVKETVVLPSSSFDVYARKHAETELNVASRSGLGQQLYNWQKRRPLADSRPFVILDGPPYANGPPHVGHALNKILKDTFLRYKIMRKLNATFVPGWDCHGLPIELKVLKAESDPLISTCDVLRKCDSSAAVDLKCQEDEFKTWGVSADWSNPYTTSSLAYISRELDAFHRLYEKGLVYRSMKPVYYSPSSRTTLANAELVYNDEYKSRAMFVRFPLADAPNHFVVAWTTTPWTLFFNDAIFYHPSLRYVEVSPPGSMEVWVMAEDTVDALSIAMGVHLRKIQTFSPEGRTYLHPILRDGKLRKIHAANFVKSGVGSGFVHGSFAHGFDDAVAGSSLGYAIPASCLDDAGCYPIDFPIPELRAKSVLGEGNDIAAQLFNPFVLHEHSHVHSYPCDWRTKEPVIIRSSLQWFVDCVRLRPRALELLDTVNFVPDAARGRMELQLTSQPSWCISRQRVWGTPIPSWYDASGKHYVNRALTDYFLDQWRSRGRGVWWDGSMENLPISVRREANIPDDVLHLKPGRDIFDIWFDSGLAWYCSADSDGKIDTQPSPRIVDVVVEGHDQLRGWFATSIFTSIALQDCMPFKNVVVHGFAVDSEGRKMSKSLGNVTHPSDITHKPTDFSSIDPELRAPVLGVDGLRQWVATNGTASHSRVGKEHLKDVYKHLRKLRLTFKFLLGALGRDLAELRELRAGFPLHPLDLWMLSKTGDFVKSCEESYENYDTSSLTLHVLVFVRDVVSSIYFESIKDRLYCDPLRSQSRTSAQITLSYLLDGLLGVLSPILPHLTEEVAYHCAGMECGSVFTRGWPDIPDDRSNAITIAGNDIAQVFDQLLPFREEFIAKRGGHSVRHKIMLAVHSSRWYEELWSINGGGLSQKSDLCDFFRCASVELSLSERGAAGEKLSSFEQQLPLETNLVSDGLNHGAESKYFDLFSRKADGQKCMRCRRSVAPASSNLCDRCERIVVDFHSPIEPRELSELGLSQGGIR